MVSGSEELKPRARAKRHQICAGAQRLFIERGFAGTSTDAIAAEAGVSKQTLYAYYPSKEDLLVDVLRQFIGEGPREWMLENEPSLEDLEHLREALVSLACRIVATLMQPDWLALVRVIVAETPRLPQLGELFCSTVPERGRESFCAFLEHARERGLVGDVKKDVAWRMFVGPLLTYFMLGGLLLGQPQHKPDAESIEEIVDLYVKAIAAREESST